MKNKIIIFFILLSTFTGCIAKAPTHNEAGDPVSLAKQAYKKAASEGVDFSSGPCLGIIMNDWVADIAHNPRQKIDNLPENQCKAYRLGQIRHFVELDLNGNFIKKH